MFCQMNMNIEEKISKVQDVFTLSAHYQKDDQSDGSLKIISSSLQNLFVLNFQYRDV